MKFIPTAVVALATAALVVLSPANANPAVNTNYSYYAVTGATLPQIYHAMVAKAPSAAGTLGFGVTTALPSPKMTVANCKASGHYQIGVNVNIQLPKASGTAKLSSSESAQWSSFVQFVKRHEEKHGAIWRSCAADFERNFNAAAPADCAAAHNRAMSMWRQMVSACMPRQVAFDASQAPVLKSHPFMKYASR